jgi:hypothetical protein
MRKKKGRYAPIIQEQAKQGLATKMVTEGKARELQKEQWEFEKGARQQELANQQKQLKMQKKQAKWDKTADYIDLGINAVGTIGEAVSWLMDW